MEGGVLGERAKGQLAFYSKITSFGELLFPSPTLETFERNQTVKIPSGREEIKEKKGQAYSLERFPAEANNVFFFFSSRSFHCNCYLS